VDSERGPWWNDLSLDVALGALVGLLWAARICEIRLPVASLVILPLATFSVYTLDHLLDARTLGRRAVSSRHRLHARAFRLLVPAAVLAAGSSVVLAVIFLSPTAIFGGILLGLACLAHQFGVRRLPRRWPKEFFIATIYVISLWWIPLVESAALESRFLLAMAAHLAVAWVHLLSFAILERVRDEADGFPSAVTRRGERSIRKRVAVIAIGGAIVAFAAGGVVLWILPLLLIAYLLPELQQRLRPQRGWHRWVGDAAFLWLGIVMLLP
jgi:hypothetical protein